MKKIILPFIAITALSLGSCNTAGDEEYKNMSSDMCDCMTKASKDISPEMQKAVVDGNKAGKDMTAIMTDYMAQNPEGVMNDVTAFQTAAVGFEKCGKDLETKYKDVYTRESEDEAMKKLVKIMGEDKGCAFVHATVQLGLKEK
ncbi:MAG: hypothetical protein ACK476_14095 [Fluviicola sp.]